MRREKRKIVSKEPRIRNGKRTGTNLIDEDGRKFALLTPHGKGAKYATELKENRRRTNDGLVKKDKNGKEQRLTKQQKAFRSGYLQAQTDSARAYKAKNKK